MSEPEKRVHPRSEYFLIKSEGQAVPIYAFREAADTAAIPALVVDLSEGGVQVLTTHSTALAQETYALEIVLGAEQGPPLERIMVAKIWDRRDGLHYRTGFAFRDHTEVRTRLVTLLAHASHHLLRCVLHPQSGA